MLVLRNCASTFDELGEVRHAAVLGVGEFGIFPARDLQLGEARWSIGSSRSWPGIAHGDIAGRWSALKFSAVAGCAWASWGGGSLRHSGTARGGDGHLCLCGGGGLLVCMCMWRGELCSLSGW